MTTRISCLLCVLSLLPLAAGCGGGTSDSGGTAAADTTSASAPEARSPDSDKPKKGAWGVVFGAEGEPLGLILYDLSGHTLYTFSKDKGGASACYGACAKTWPPALTERKPRADGSAVPSKVGATKRKDGTVQLTYADHPLYTYSQDGSSEVNGNGTHAFGGDWYAIRPSGEKP